MGINIVFKGDQLRILTKKNNLETSINNFCYGRTSYLAKAYMLRPVHTTPEEFENGALFLRLGLPSTLIQRHCPPKTELFENTLENRGI